MSRLGQKWAPREAAASYMYKAKPMPKGRTVLLKTSAFPNKDVLPDGAILQDGTEVRLVPLDLTKGKVLYVSRNGKGYSYKGGKFQAIKDAPRRITDLYRRFRHYGMVGVHTAVKSAWDRPCPPGYQCDHINGDAADNRLENLEWVTREENARRRWLNHFAKGENYHGKRLTELGRDGWRKRKRTAKKYGYSIELALGAKLLEIK